MQNERLLFFLKNVTYVKYLTSYVISWPHEKCLRFPFLSHLLFLRSTSLLINWDPLFCPADFCFLCMSTGPYLRKHFVDSPMVFYSRMYVGLGFCYIFMLLKVVHANTSVLSLSDSLSICSICVKTFLDKGHF